MNCGTIHRFFIIIAGSFLSVPRYIGITDFTTVRQDELLKEKKKEKLYYTTPSVHQKHRDLSGGVGYVSNLSYEPYSEREWINPPCKRYKAVISRVNQVTVPGTHMHHATTRN